MSFWDAFEDGISFFNQPSMDSRRIFQLSLLSDQPLLPDSPCPTDSNCTFSISFAAPSYKCEHRDDFGGIRTYNLSQMAPFGDLLYASYSSFEEDFVGRPLGWNRTVPNNDTGVFKQEPSLWVAWAFNTTLLATVENTTQWNTTYWPHQLTTHIMECSFWNSTYGYNLSYRQGKMTVNGSGVRQDTLMLPPGSVMDPYMETYMEWAGFHGTGWLYRTMLAGNISQKGQQDYVITESDISQTNILDPGNGMPYDEDLGPAIEKSFHNVYLSFLADIKQQSQLFVDMPCEASAHVLVWSYCWNIYAGRSRIWGEGWMR
ncbi:hypothetical protein GE09DRAFT_174885 [Coniochaeta sp. 2T2.1]|nr:hypothetical protein GE09DRAFT_174885 [Coniochaeta sp. 2T2.1]